MWHLSRGPREVLGKGTGSPPLAVILTLLRLIPNAIQLIYWIMVRKFAELLGQYLSVFSSTDTSRCTGLHARCALSVLGGY